MQSDSVLVGIQQTAANRLMADPFFSDLKVVTENISDIENEIERAIASLGIVVIVVTPTASVRQMKDAPGPYFEDIRIVVQVSESVTLNRSAQGTNKTALQVAEYALAVLHGFQPPNLSEAYYAENPTIALVPDPNGLLTYHVMLNTHGGIRYPINTVSTPVIANASNQVSISCATSNAQVFYSVGPTNWPTPLLGTIYSGPFNAAPGSLVRSKAYLAGYIDSLMTTYTTVDNGLTPVAYKVRVKDGALQTLCPDNNLWYGVTTRIIDGQAVVASTGDGEL